MTELGRETVAEELAEVLGSPITSDRTRARAALEALRLAGAGAIRALSLLDQPVPETTKGQTP